MSATGPVKNYWYSTLTAAIDDKASPLRRYLDTTFPNTRLVTTPHSKASPLIAVTGTPVVNPGTLGTAFDALVSLRYQPNTIPAAARPFARERGNRMDAWVNILGMVAQDQTLIEAAAWAYALAIEAFRSPVMPYDLDDLIHERGGFDEHDLLAIATTDAIEQLAALEELAKTHLYPHLGTPPEPDATIDLGSLRAAAWTQPTCSDGAATRFFGPTFEASRLCAADADLIHDGILYEFKTRLGTNRKPNRRVDALPLIDLYQLITYPLFDTNDVFALSHVSVYSARYARHSTWDLTDLLSTLAGRPINIAEERAAVWTLLAQGHRA